MTNELFSRVKSAQDAALEDASLRDGVEARVLASARRPAPPRTNWQMLAAASAAMLVLGVSTTWALTRPPTPRAVLGYEVNGGAPSMGGFVAALEPAQVRFSDESVVNAHRGASVRVVTTSPDGAGVAIEQGEIDVHVVHEAQTDWRFFAGPFAIVVTGTRFDAAWLPERATLAVSVTEGAVRIEGACIDAPRAVRSGEHVELSCERWIAESEVNAPIALLSSPESADPEPSHAAALPRSARVPVTVVAPEISEVPVAPALEGPTTPIEDARVDQATRAALAGDIAGAERTLREVRDTRGGTDDASLAAFLLGRLAFDEQHDYEEAATWFATYVSERADGPLVREALGRELEARMRSGDDAGARDVATRYLARFPEGPHARRARTLLDSPTPG